MRTRRTAATTVLDYYYMSGICSNNFTWTHSILTSLWKYCPSLKDEETETLKA